MLKNEKELELAKKDPLLANAHLVLLPQVPGNLLKSSRQFYKYCRLNKENIFDILHYSVPRVYPFYWKFPARNIVCTFHAGGDVTVPADKFVLSRRIYNLIIKLQWRKFKAIIADSKFAQNEISTAYKIPIDKIQIIHLGSDSLWHLKIPENTVKLNQILIVGRWQKYKNVHTVVEALKKYVLPKNPQVKIFIVGKSNQLGRNNVLKAIEGISYSQIKLADYLEDDQLALEYRRSSVVFHPSINEGFGLPAFEAFGEGANLIVHHGTPADDLLSGSTGFIAANLLDEDEIVKSYNSIKNSETVDVFTRRKYLESKGATWESMTNKYISLYKVLFDQ